MGRAGYGEDGGSVEVGVRVPGAPRGKVTRLSEGKEEREIGRKKIGDSERKYRKH